MYIDDMVYWCYKKAFYERKDVMLDGIMIGQFRKSVIHEIFMS